MKILSQKRLADTILNGRKQKGLTQQKLAELTGISASFISDLENGKPSAELGRAIDLANILGMNVLFSPR